MFNNEPRKFFKGHGVALGGHLRQPMAEPIPSQASAAIPLSGGFDSARVERFNHREIVSFRSAYTLVSGYETKERLETVVTTVVEGLDILGVVTADKIVARLSGSLPVLEHANPTVTPSGSYFQNLRICGEEVKCRFVGASFDKMEAKADYLARVNKDLEPQLLPAQGWDEKGFLPVSLCSNVSLGGKQLATGKFHVDIEHFGRIHLSEFLVSRNSHRLTMLRVELGCPVQGSIDAGTVEGEPYIMP